MVSSAAHGPAYDYTTGSQAELQNFLRVIQLDFLKVVDPMGDNLIDIMMASGLLTDSDNESLSGRDVATRKDQARKLWLMLNKMSVKDFLAKVGPELCTNFPHIIPAAYLTCDVDTPSDVTKPLTNIDGCLHHEIKGRIRLSGMADVLYHQQRLDFLSYEAIISEEINKNEAWEKIFNCCIGHDTTASQLPKAVAALLCRYNVHVPSDLAGLLDQGVPCTCSVGQHPPQEYLPRNEAQRVQSWRMRAPSRESLSSSVSTRVSSDTTSHPSMCTLSSSSTTVDDLETEQMSSLMTDEQADIERDITNQRQTCHSRWRKVKDVIRTFLCRPNALTV